MIEETSIKYLFLDIGGVLLTNGWDHEARGRAVKEFNLNPDEMEYRHKLVFDTYELGKLTLKQYLSWVVFYEERKFTPLQFRNFMFSQSKPFPKMIELMRRLKQEYFIKISVVNNEARELNSYRIQKYKLDEFVDIFTSSNIVHLRKPDPEIFRFALDVAQAPIDQVLYIENTPLYVQIAEGMGIKSILHTDYQSTYQKLASLGLK